MPSDKSRLHVALYARGGRQPGGSDPATYHWALIVGPKTEGPNDCGIRYHAKDRTTPTATTEWRFERVEISIHPTMMILTRITVAKVLDPKKLDITLRETPVLQNDSNWNCISWVKNALEALHKSGCLGTHESEWEVVKQAAMDYVTRKVTEHRFDGKLPVDTMKVPTYDLMERKEVVP